MSYSTILNTTVIGYCLGMCSGTVHKIIHACDISELDKTVCRDLHRTGQMCGQCKKDYSPPIYSYSLACVKCTHYKYNWLKYIAVAFLPLTFFYIIIVTFRISVMSKELQTYIIICQMLSAPGLMRFLHLSTKSDPIGKPFFHVFSTVYGIWNLDFFRSIYPPFCLHPSLTTLHVLALDYAVAVYPILLILITYMCVILHDRSRIIIWLWSPFHKCLVYFRREWFVKKSLIDVFATFLLLSYVKILNVSFDILIPTTLFDVKGSKVKALFLYFDGTVQYFKGTHTYFATIALIMSFIFNIIPLVLIALHPSRCFQRCLNHFQLRSQTFTTFMDAFQGSFKTQPYDCRYFAAFYLFLRIANLLILSWTRSGLYFHLSGYIFTFASLVVATFRPYPKMVNTILDVVLLLSVSLASFWYSVFFSAIVLDPFHCSNGSLIVICLLVSLPAAYAGFLCLYRVARLNLSQVRRQLVDRELSYQQQASSERVPILLSN